LSQSIELPDKVIWNGQEKDFGEALEALYIDLIRKIQDSRDVNVLLKGPSERIRWIRSTFGLSLTNKVFKQPISRYQINKRKFLKKKAQGIFDAANSSNFRFQEFMEKIECLSCWAELY
jgi:hypothetical protein